MRSIALFGKPDARADYRWLRGRERIPPALFGACEAMTENGGEDPGPAALAALLHEGLFLVRVYRRGMDSAFRPVDQLEVAEVDSEPPLGSEELLALAWSATSDRALAEAGGEQSVALPIPAAHKEPPAIDPILRDRVRLGLPVTTRDDGQALAILRAHGHRFQGVVWARGESPLAWAPAFAPYLGLGLRPPPTTPEAETALALLAGRPPSDEEWRFLDRLKPERVRAALAWAAGLEGAERPMAASPDDPLFGWYLAFRRSSNRGASLLAALHQDLTGEPLPPQALEVCFPELSAAARDALASWQTVRRSELAVETLEELADAGLLVDGSPLSPRSWVSRAGESARLRSEAETLLASRGIVGDPALFVLGLAPDRAVTAPDAQHVAGTAYDLGFPCRIETLERQLQAARSPGDIELVTAFGEAYGGEAGALARVVGSGQPPAAGVLDPSVVATALAARARTVDATAPLTALAGLITAGREDEAAAIVAAYPPDETLPERARAVLAARLGGEPVPVGSSDEIASLAALGIARPQDVVPAAAGLRPVAALWPATEPLIGALDGTGPPPASGACPDPWLSAVRAALDPPGIGVWLRCLAPADRLAARTWLVQVLDLPPTSERLLAGAGGWRAIAGDDLSRTLKWMTALAAAEDRVARLRLIASIARDEVLAEDDPAAEQLVRDLLPNGGDRLRAVLVHALSGVGPQPAVDELPAAALALVVDIVPPIPLVDALFNSVNSHLTSDAELVAAIRRRLHEVELPCPVHGYTREQRHRHLVLAASLAELPGWSALAEDEETRRRLLDATARRLGLRAARDGRPTILPESQLIEEGEQ